MGIAYFYRLRFCGAALALLFAILYLIGCVQIALVGFSLIGVYGTFICIRIQQGSQPGKCDLCGAQGLLKVEYGHGFSNVRLILDCPSCGWVVNTSSSGIKPGLAEDQ